jgi:hypothetical protein
LLACVHFIHSNVQKNQRLESDSSQRATWQTRKSNKFYKIKNLCHSYCFYQLGWSFITSSPQQNRANMAQTQIRFFASPIVHESILPLHTAASLVGRFEPIQYTRIFVRSSVYVCRSTKIVKQPHVYRVVYLGIWIRYHTSV